MSAGESPARRGVPFCLAVVVVVLAAVGKAGGAVDPPPGRVAELIEALRKTKVGEEKQWAAAVRELTEIGKPAVPALVEELDRTTDQWPLRSIGFTLRAIGDPRAVPALIRAIPRTLIGSSSDFGLTVDDPKLFAFMKAHDLDPEDSGGHFGFGRPFREITGALHTITGQRFNEDELNFIHLEGGPTQRRLQRRRFHQLAEHWALWWLKNRKRLTDDPAYALVNLPSLPDQPGTLADPDRPFPTGPKVQVSGTTSNVILGPPQPLKYYRTFKDLDTGGDVPWPKELPAVEDAKPEVVEAWAKREGFDLRGIEYRAPGSGQPTYALQGLGLRAWQIDDRRFDTIATELRKEGPPDLGRPAGDLLMDFDPKSKAYHPEKTATFLFVTRDGATGVLQVTNLITELLGKQDIGQPVQAKTNRGFYRGVQFQFKLIYEDE